MILLVTKKKASLWPLYRAEERSWLQKSRAKWLQEGDRNTKFFHVVASTRRRGNCIDKLIVQGKEIKKPGEIREVIAQHFESHFNYSQVIRLNDWSCHLRHLSVNKAKFLEQPFSVEEIWEVIRKSDGNKAPGPDGFNMHFIKTHWNLIKEDVMKVFDCFFSSGTFDYRMNAFFIALIPKCSSPLGLNDYRPISLVGYMYKLLSKVLANRLREVMDEVIGPNQFSFIKGRQILDCSLVANEVIDEIKKEGGWLYV